MEAIRAAVAAVAAAVIMAAAADRELTEQVVVRGREAEDLLIITVPILLRRRSIRKV